MFPDFSRLEPIPPKWNDVKRRSAVVMLFVADKEQEAPAQIVLTRRSLSVGTHKRQIGFPGGRADPGDKGPAETALRELGEELGVPPSEVKLHGMVQPTRALDRTPVLAVVGSTPFPARDFKPSPVEVDEVFLVPWPELMREKSESFRFNLFGNWRDSQLFRVQGLRVWGLTAHLIYSADLRCDA